MDRSEHINDLAAALALAQGNYKTVKRSGRNPNFNSSYATLDDVIAAVRKPLSNEAIAYTQMVGYGDGGYTLTTMLMHESGQFLSETLPVIIQDALVSRAGKKVRTDLQELGNALTYLKRYMLTSALGVNMEIDADGNASGQKRKQQAPSPQSEKARAAQEEKARIADRRESVKLTWIALGKNETGHLSDPIQEGEWERFYADLGDCFTTIKRIGVPDGGFDKLRDEGISRLRANAPNGEPETVEENAHALEDEDFTGGIPPLD